MIWKADEPYNDLPLLPPHAEFETRSVLKATTRARAALAAMDEATKRMPNPMVLVNSLSLLEAQASSEIENIVTTTDELFRFAQDAAESASAETKETLRYRTALFSGMAAIRQRPLSVNTAIEVCTNIHRRDMRVRDLPGTYIGDPTTRSAIYTPPTGESTILQKLDNWVDFVHTRQDIDPLVVMAITHYQFEAIHPFADGNGRTGRILNVLQLVEADLLREPILYLSRFIIQNKSAYYRLLLGVTADAGWEDWILFVLRGIEETAVQTLSKIDRIQALQNVMRAEIREHTTAGSNADLLDVLFENPYARINDVVERCGVSRPTATNWLNTLEAIGALIDLRVGRERLFINQRFMRILSTDEEQPSTSADRTG